MEKKLEIVYFKRNDESGEVFKQIIEWDTEILFEYLETYKDSIEVFCINTITVYKHE